MKPAVIFLAAGAASVVAVQLFGVPLLITVIVGFVVGFMAGLLG